MSEPPEVPYLALYRRFRPQRFTDVVGQDHVTRPLRAAVRDGKVAHAYLFSGPRGTGKTSTARILAMALNCEHPADGEPDGTCPSCVAIRQGVSLDVQELDAATNRGIDEMRDLLSRVALGTPGRWKVYIIDEVHQMTAAASSALLKTLEEPPEHVIFVLATTDPQKVLETIRSRTQHFEFRLLGVEVLTGLLRDVADRAALDVAPEAIDLVVRRGHGSARDALSVLDQVAAAGGVEEELGAVTELVDAFVERDTGRALEAVAAAAMQGVDPRRLGTEVLEYLRNGFLATRAPDLVLLAPEATSAAEQRARGLGAANLVRAMELIGQALIDMREAADPRTTLEVALVRLTAPEVDDSRGALVARIERLEAALAGGAEAAAPGVAAPRTGAPAAGRSSGKSNPSSVLGAPPPMPGGRAPAPRKVEPQSTPASAGPPVESEGAGSDPVGATMPTREELTLAWGDQILSGLRPAVKVYLASGRFVAAGEGVALFAVPDKGLLSRAEPSLGEVEAALAAHFGRPVPLKLVLDDGSWAGPAVAAGDEPDEEPADYDLASLEDAPPAATVTPEQRLLEAFPGAEEVEP